MYNDQQQLQDIIQMGAEIQRIQDIDHLLEKILSASRKIANADAGTIYIRQGNRLQFSHAQNETLQQRLPAGQKLIYQTFSIPIDHHSIAGYVASTGETLNIQDVYRLHPDQHPYIFDRSYDEKAQYRTQAMLTLPLRNARRRIVGVMQLINAQNDEGQMTTFSNQDVPLIKVFANNAVKAIERAQTTRAEILGLVQVLTEIRDPEETIGHVNRVGACSVEIYEAWARKKGVPGSEIETNSELLRMAAMLHDLGKLAIPQNIRQKPGRFTAEEYRIMQQHTVKGARMLLKSAQTEYEVVASQIALNHHEYWNGSGYPGHVDLETGEVRPGYADSHGRPRGKWGEEIPVFGRVVAIADVYDALSSRRAFRRALKEDAVLQTLKKGAGRRFDPEMIDAFFSRLDTIRAIARRFPDAEPQKPANSVNVRSTGCATCYR